MAKNIKLYKKRVLMAELNIPKTWDSLEQFALWYKKNNMPWRPPVDSKVYISDQTYSFVVFRQGRFQAELYLVKPNTISTPHSHPFSQMTIFLGGSVTGFREGNEANLTYGDKKRVRKDANKDEPHNDFKRLSSKLERDQFHELEVYNDGCAILVLQDWGDLEPTSAIIKYDGPSLGPVHDNTKGDANEST